MTETLSPETVRSYLATEGRRRTLWPLNRCATRDAVRRFLLGVGDDNPLWWDEARPTDEAFAPPTFLYSGVNFGSWPDLGGGPAEKGQPTVTLWAGDHWRWTSHLRLGEAFEAASEIFEVREKRVGEATVGLRLRERVRFTGEGGRELASFVRTTVTMPRREAPAPSPEAPPLTAEELRRVEDCYDEEPGRRRGAEPRWWDSVAPGDAVGPIVKGPLTVTNLVGWVIGWGAPLCPTNRMLRQWVKDFPGAVVRNRRTGGLEGPEGIHWDHDVFSAFGYRQGFDFGPQRISWAAHLCTDWCGDAGRLLELDARLLRTNPIGDVTWFTGRVQRRWTEEDGRGCVELEIEGRNQRDELTTVARAVIELPVR